jgi:hypothetical protein
MVRGVEIDDTILPDLVPKPIIRNYGFTSTFIQLRL